MSPPEDKVFITCLGLLTFLEGEETNPSKNMKNLKTTNCLKTKTLSYTSTSKESLIFTRRGTLYIAQKLMSKLVKIISFTPLKTQFTFK